MQVLISTSEHYDEGNEVSDVNHADFNPSNIASTKATRRSDVELDFDPSI